jgi:hypothetical protein
VCNNSTGISSLLSTPLIPVLLRTLDSLLLLTDKSSDKNIDNAVNGICNCFINCTWDLLVKVVSNLVEAKLIERMMNVIEKYISQMKMMKGNSKLSENTEESASRVLLNISGCGSEYPSDDGKNIFKNNFEENDILNRLIHAFEFLNLQQNPSFALKNILNKIAVCVCDILRNERPPSTCKNVVIYVSKLISSPSPTSEFDDTENARISWGEMVDPSSLIT